MYLHYKAYWQERHQCRITELAQPAAHNELMSINPVSSMQGMLLI
jgi:hypothetical protein